MLVPCWQKLRAKKSDTIVGGLSNKKLTEIRLLIIQSLQELVDKRIIKLFFKTTQKDNFLIVETNLTFGLITKSKVIYLEEILHYKNSINQLINKLENMI